MARQRAKPDRPRLSRPLQFFVVSARPESALLSGGKAAAGARRSTLAAPKKFPGNSPRAPSCVCYFLGFHQTCDFLEDHYIGNKHGAEAHLSDQGSRQA